MAEILKREYDLLTLKVSLDTADRETRVTCDLEGMAEGQFGRLDGWVLSADDMGLPDHLEARRTLYGGYAFRLPEHLVEGLRQAIGSVEPSGQPLWLHLVKPYGYLGMVPWERLLQPALQIPLLRLPDFLADPPRETPSVLDVVLCTSLPTAKESFMVVDRLTEMIPGILAAVPRRTTIHLFTDAEWHPSLEHRLKEMGLLEGPVELHDPQEAGPYAAPEATLQVRDRPGAIENPWLLWIRDALKGQSIDIAHFICHGFLSRDRGALAFSETPLRNEDRRMARFVGAAELTAFLTQTGAWSVAFSSPENNYSEMGLRQLADAIAQLRPGPVVHHEITGDSGGAALAGVYRFLFGPAPQEPPASPALFTYCHPSRVTGKPKARTLFSRAAFQRIVNSAENVPSHPLLKKIFQKDENVPSWIAASQRFIEQQNLDLLKLSGETGAKAEKAVEGMRQTLKQIQDVIARAADTTRRGGKP